jgi:hypothetical protein
MKSNWAKSECSERQEDKKELSPNEEDDDERKKEKECIFICQVYPMPLPTTSYFASVHWRHE